MQTSRIITKYKGNAPGPLLIVFGGMHGNEPAGIKAIEMMSKMLEVEPITNPEFSYKGSFLGMIGHLQAFHENKRFIHSDLNRLWTKENVKHVDTASENDLKNEFLEMKQILSTVRETISEMQPERVVVLDLHTTSSFGGIFSIATDDKESLRIAVELHAPVIKGLLDGIQGTTLHYFTTENFGISMTPVTFESGQHNEQLSINRAVAAITNCMRTIGSVKADDVEHQHDKLLITYSADLPKVSQLHSIHQIKEGDDFRMMPNYKNFQRISKGEILAHDKSGEITAPDDLLIVMPLYQKQGNDGFFLVREVDHRFTTQTEEY